MRKLKRLIAELEQWERELLLDLLQGRFALTVGFAVRKTSLGWDVVDVSNGHKYVVIDDACTCPDAKFRQHVCKHAKALECIR